MPDFSKFKPATTGTRPASTSTSRNADNDMAMKFDGFLKIARDGEYRFRLTSDDGSKLWIDGKPVVANDGIHAPTTASAA